MEELITSYLLQKGQIALPDIGVIRMNLKSAEIDDANKKILPPAYEYNFIEDISQSPDDLIKYISYKENIDIELAKNELRIICKKWKEKIDSGEELCFDDFGCLKKDDTGRVSFKMTSNYQYLMPLSIEGFQAVEEDALISDNEKDISEIKNEYADIKILPAKYSWMKWAIILFVIGLIALLFHFYNQRYSTASSGNQSGFPVSSPHNTYIIPK